MPSFTLIPHKVSTRFTDPIVAPLASMGVTPNMISVAGFAGNVGAGVLAAGGYFVAAGIVMLFFSALDLLDGALARKTGTVTKFGAVYVILGHTHYQMAERVGTSLIINPGSAGEPRDARNPSGSRFARGERREVRGEKLALGN